VSPRTAGFQRIAPIEAGESEVEFPEMAAIGGLPAFTKPALSTRLVREHDMISTADTTHSLSGTFYNSGAFMTQN
jgi:hypothetical protein